MTEKDHSGQWDGSEFIFSANESGWQKYLPGVRTFKIHGVNPNMSLKQILEAHPHVGEVIDSMKSIGLYVIPIVIFGGVSLFSATRPDLLGETGNLESLRKSKERGMMIAKKIQRMTRRRKIASDDFTA